MYLLSGETACILYRSHGELSGHVIFTSCFRLQSFYSVHLFLPRAGRLARKPLTSPNLVIQKFATNIPNSSQQLEEAILYVVRGYPLA